VLTSDIHTRVEAPPIAPHPFGLFSVAPPATPAETTWQLGVSWESWACIDPNTTTDACIDGSTPAAKEFEQCPDTNYVKPLTVFLGVKRSGGGVDAENLASGSLQGAEEFAVERWLWERMVDDSAPVVGAPAFHPDPAVAALAAVEAALGAGYMGTGIIHMNRGLATALASHLVVKGNQLQTIAGTPVAAGAGYNLDLLSGGPVTIYGTGAVMIRRSTVTASVAWDRAINDELALAERTYAVGWDCYVIGRTAGT
jgi:hypothetical protein